MPATRTATAPTATHTADEPVAARVCTRTLEGFVPSSDAGAGAEGAGAGVEGPGAVAYGVGVDGVYWLGAGVEGPGAGADGS